MIERPDLAKPLVLSRHAFSRTGVRQFTEEDVRYVLNAATWLGPAKEGAKFAEATLPSGRILRVIYDDTGPTIRIVTVFPRRRIE